MKFKFFLLTLVICSQLSYSQTPHKTWEYIHPALSEQKTFFKGMKVSYTGRIPGIFSTIEQNLEHPTLLVLDSLGKLVKVVTNENIGSLIFEKLVVKQTNLNRYCHSFALGTSITGDPIQIHQWIDTLGRHNRMGTLGYLKENDRKMTNEHDAFLLVYPTLTTVSGPLFSVVHYYNIDSTLTVLDNEYVVRMKMTETYNSGSIRRKVDSIVEFRYQKSNFPLIPFPMANTQNDSGIHHILHAPDTLYSSNPDTAIRVTKHIKTTFKLDSIFVPNPTQFVSAIPNQRFFAPKALTTSSNSFAIVGNIEDNEGNRYTLVHRSKYDGTNEETVISSKNVLINSCRIREDGTIVAVGKKLHPDDNLKNDDFYIGILRPGSSSIQEFSWGTMFEDGISDVTFLPDGDFVISGYAWVNCYVARIATDNPTSVGESVPFSSSIGFAPNPASSQTLVRFAPTTDGIATAELYDMRGMKVKELFSEHVQRGNEYTFPAPVSDVPNGVYTVIITNGITKHHQQLQVIR
jgi:hypothetical protein